MRNGVPVDPSGPVSSDSMNVLVSVADDFAALAAVFDRQLDQVSASEEEIREHIAKAKEAAERGLSLCEDLIGRFQSRGAVAENG